MRSQTERQKITVHILVNISEGNQAIKFGKLIEYNVIQIFL